MQLYRLCFPLSEFPSQHRHKPELLSLSKELRLTYPLPLSSCIVFRLLSRQTKHNPHYENTSLDYYHCGRDKTHWMLIDVEPFFYPIQYFDAG